VAAWSSWAGSGNVSFEERRWPRLGTQRIPVAFTLYGASDLAAVIGEGTRWRRAAARYGAFTARWPGLDRQALAREFSLLADYDDAAMAQLMALLDWLVTNPASGLYLRQLPVESIDTKWVEQRKAIVSDLLRALQPEREEVDFFALCGLARAPHRVRLRLLDPALAQSLGGLRDIEAPLDEVASLVLAPRAVVIVENLETGVALPDLHGTVAFMKLGHGVKVLRDIPWLARVPTLYWGDLDTHGFGILDKARSVLPQVRSVLMDEATLLENRVWWGTEASPHPDVELTYLTDPERAVYRGLRENRWGERVRLEQERLPWGPVVAVLKEALAACGSGGEADRA
jgi:hypothetical protein